MAKMQSPDPGVVKAVHGVLTQPAIKRWTQRAWYCLCRRCAVRKFRSLLPDVLGLLEQLDEGNVRDEARAALAAELEVLRVLPRAIRGRRGYVSMGPELDYLRGCMMVPKDRLSLPLAQTAFAADKFGDPDFTKDVLGTYYEDLKKKLESEHHSHDQD